MNLRWLYLAIYLGMGGGMVSALYNPSPDGFITTVLVVGSVFLLLLGAGKLEQPYE
jgi:hypothetical protein